MKTAQFLPFRKRAPWFALMFFPSVIASASIVHCASERRTVASDEQVNRLLMVVRDVSLQKKDPEQVREAIQRLGRLKAAAAVGDLIKVLAFRPETRWDTMAHRTDKFQVLDAPLGHSGHGRYPAIYALVEIGLPALPALVKVIETNDFDSVESKNARVSVRLIFFGDPSKADEFFKEAAGKASTLEAKRRLLHALETADEDWKSD
jgi:hypothetical protein